jgi:N-acetylmuramoyl-L-alanine amidase
MLIVGSVDRADTYGSGHADFLARLRRRVEQSIESQAQMQALHVQADLSPSERTSFVNSIKAELVILLDARGEPGEGGIATYYFSKSNAVSDVGRSASNYIREELVNQTGAKDFGSYAEDSEDLMLPTAPTVSVEVGNFGDSSDLVRFLGGP